MSEIRITDVRAAIVASNFDWPLVRIDTDAGIRGYGEAFTDRRVQRVKSAILDLKPLLLGEDPMDIDRLVRKMGLSPWDHLTAKAISGLEMALWDIKGQALHTPVYNLLGGKFRDRIRIYCDCHGGVPIATRADYSYERKELYAPEAYAANARRIKALGFSFLKFDLYPGVPTPYPRYGATLSSAEVAYLAEIVRALREAVGEDRDLAIDFGAYTTSDAIRLITAMEDLHLAWAEDIIPWNAQNAEALAQVTAAVKTPTLTGEMISSYQGFRELVVKQAVRIVAPDMAVVGGLYETKKVAELADLYHMPVAPHNVASPVGTMAAVHCSAAISNFIGLEFHSVALPWWQDLIKGPKPIIQEGFIQVPEGPGLGIELDEEQLTKHLAEGEEPFFA